jgi:twitching motility protein PilT
VNLNTPPETLPFGVPPQMSAPPRLQQAPQPQQAPQSSPQPLAAQPAAQAAPSAPPARPTVPFGSIEHLYGIINSAGRSGVSDIHIVPKKGIWRLIQGELAKDSSPSYLFDEKFILGWLEYAGKGGLKVAEPLGERGHTSVAFDTGMYRVRASFRRTTEGVSVTFRVIPAVVPDVEKAGVPLVMQNLMNRTAGLILIEGPTGSGKTTAIAALINKLNLEQNLHIYTIEDPIEFVHKPNGNSMFTQREIGEHASDFPSAVENALRSKPNVIVVGELLNPATAKAALHAATTGHLVITTAHAGSVTEALDSFIGQFTADEQPQIRSRLSQSLLAIMVQKLVPAKGGGLVAVREIMINDLNFSELLRDDKVSNMIHQSMESTAGSNSLEQDLLALVQNDRIAPATAMEQCRKPAQMAEMLKRVGAAL